MLDWFCTGLCGNRLPPQHSGFKLVYIRLSACVKKQALSQPKVRLVLTGVYGISMPTDFNGLLAALLMDLYLKAVYFVSFCLLS